MKRYDTIRSLKKLRDHAESTPERIAVVDRGAERSVSCREFYRTINSFALYIKNMGFGKETTIVIGLDRVMENLAMRLACLFTGYRFVNVNPSYPEQRKQLICQLCAPYFIVDETVLSGVPLVDAPCQIDESICDDEEAYVDFTSGTTGVPKGILHDRSVFAHCETVPAIMLDLGGVNNYAALSDLMFALSIGEMSVLFCGIPFHLVSDAVKRDPEKLKRYFIENDINSTSMLPSMLRTLAPFPTLRVCWTVGERNDFDFSDLGITVLNLYGSSEVTAISYGIKGKDAGIGRSFGAGKVFLKDEAGKTIPSTDTSRRGEICYTGPGIMIRYLDNEEETARAVMTDPATGEKVFHTRDMGKYNRDGTISIFGRIDSTVKVRGNRVDLAEIEYHLLHRGDVMEAAVRAFEVNNENILCAFYSTGEQTPLPEDDIRAALVEKMPAYMVPAYFVHVTSFSRNVHGKIDRNALALPERVGKTGSLPLDEVEKKVAEIFEEILQKSPVGREDRFSEMGGSSLSALRLQMAVAEAFGVSLGATELLRTDSVSAIAAAVRQAAGKGPVRTSATGREPDMAPLIDSSRFIWDNVMTLDSLNDRRMMSYNTPFLMKITGLDAAEITEKYRMVFDAHPGLKVRLEVRDGVPVLVKQDEWEPVFSCVELNEEPDIEYFRERIRRFDLPKDPLIRCELYRYGDTCYALVDIHHQILDGYSIWLFLNDLKKVFTGRRPGMETRTCLDELQAIRLDSEKDDENRTYYRALLAGAESLLYPVSPTPDSDLPLYGNCTLDVSVPDLIAKAKAGAVTPHHVILAAFMSALEAATGKHSFSIVSFYSGRTEETASTAGCLYRHMPVVRAGDESADLAELARAYRQQTLESEKHRFICDLHPEVRTNVVFNDLSAYPHQDLLSGGRLSDHCSYLGINLPDMDYANIPLQFKVLATAGNGCRIGASYNRSMYHPDTIMSLLRRTAERLSTF